MARVKIQYGFVRPERPSGSSCCERNFLAWINHLVDRLREYFSVQIYTAVIDPTRDYAILDIKGAEEEIASCLAMIENLDARWTIVSKSPPRLSSREYECAECTKRRLERGY